MNKKLITLIAVKKLITLAVIFAFAAGEAKSFDLRISQIDSAFTPSVQKAEQVQESAPAIEKKSFKLWKKNTAKTTSKAEKKEKKIKNKKLKASQDKKEEQKKTFADAKKYAEEAQKNKVQEEKEQAKELKKSKRFWNKKRSKVKTVEETKQDKNEKTTVSSDKSKPSEEKSNVDVKLQTKESTSAVMTGSVSTNKIISVDDCVKLALENNPTIVSQMMSRDIYKNKIAQAWANYFPTINLGVSYSKNDMLMTNFKFPMQKYTLWNTPSAGVNMLLFDFGKTAATAKIAKKTFEASEETLQGNINDIIYNVKNAYYNLLYAMQQVAVYEDTVANYEIHLKQAQAYYKIGTKAKIDVTTAAYNLDNAKLNLIQAKNSVDMAYAQLNNAMGLPEYADYEIKEKLTSRKYDVIFDDMIKTAYDQRPQLLAAKKKMEGSKLLIRASKVAFLPDINGFGNYTKGGKNPDTDYGYQIGAQMAYSNVNLFLLKKQVDEAKLTYLKDKADYETQRQNVYLEVKQAYIQFRNAQESIPVAKASMLQAKEQYDLASGRYKVGLGDAVELKDAENTYRTSQLSYYNTLTQYNITAANLEKVVGAPILPRENNL